jgi:hypothetical protein
MDRSRQVQNITITMDGVTHEGTYYIRGSMVSVQYGTECKATQIGGWSAESIAELLLSEMVWEQRK